MKRLTIFLMVFGMFVFCSNDVFARAIGLKINYNSMMGDYSDMKLDNNISGGLFFDMGRFGFDSMDFRPGIDFVKLKNDAGTFATVWGIHCDWYWFFMEKGSLAPFIGFGPAFNYFSMNSDVAEDDDSDAGIEGFGGVEFAVNSQFKLMLELRLVFHDIANTGQQLFKPSLGASYSF